MNAERLHALALAIAKDISTSNSEALLTEVVNSLQNQINQPQQPGHQQQVSNSLLRLRSQLDEAISNQFSPGWQQLLVELGIENLLGQNLKRSIDQIFLNNTMTPAVAVGELRRILEQLITLRTAVGQLTASLTTLHIAAEELAPGHAEFGILIPRAFVDDRLDKFALELAQLDKILEPFAELATGSRESFEIKTISSTDLTVFLEMAPKLCACVAHAVEAVVTIYKKFLELRKLRAGMLEQGVDEKALSDVTKHVDNVVNNDIEKLVPELIAQFGDVKDKGRLNELTIEVRTSLKMIARQVDNGVNFEARSEPPVNESNGADGADDRSSTELNHLPYFEMIQESSKTLRYSRFDGPPILGINYSETNKQQKKDKGAPTG